MERPGRRELEKGGNEGSAAGPGGEGETQGCRGGMKDGDGGMRENESWGDGQEGEEDGETVPGTQSWEETEGQRGGGPGDKELGRLRTERSSSKGDDSQGQP